MPNKESLPKIFKPEEMEAKKSEIVARLREIDLKQEKAKGQRNPYHNADHAQEVLARLNFLLSQLTEFGIPLSDSQTMEFAALFHDYGHPGKVEAKDGTNERYSAGQADKFVKSVGLSAQQQTLLNNLIMATAMLDKPLPGKRTDLERIFTLADGADWLNTPEEWLESRANVLMEVKFSGRPLPEDIKVWLDESCLGWVRERRIPKQGGDLENPWDNKELMTKLQEVCEEKLSEKEAIVAELIFNPKSPWQEVFKRLIIDALEK